MVILTLINAYLPGYKAGGPIQSLANLTEKLGDGFRIKIITSDRDCGDFKPFPFVTPGKWQQVGNAEVLYLSPRERSPWNLRSIINASAHDVLYLNSFFHPFYSILPMALWRAGLIRRTPVVLAPRGELSPGALSLKGIRKNVFLSVVRGVRLHSHVMWQASSNHESAEIQRWFPPPEGKTNTIVAPDLPVRGHFENAERVRASRGPKQPGHLRLLFASRISPKKNLLEAIRCLANVSGTVEFNVLGPIEDETYWQKCQNASKSLPPNVTVSHWGPVLHDRVLFEMTQHDLFLLPTLGENFGHVIFESLSAGCPVLIGGETPWRGLEAKYAGWDLPVENRDAFRAVLQRCIEMNEQEHSEWRAGAKALAASVLLDAAGTRSNRDLFLEAVRVFSPKAPHRHKLPPLGVAGFPIAESRRHFNAVAPVWEKKYERGGSLRQRVNAFLGCLRQSVSAPARILDFGCGSGDIAIACSEAGYEITGVDLSLEMIARARSRSDGRGIAFDLLECDYPLQLPYPGAYFEGALASSVLEYVQNPFECLLELRRVCKPRGLLVATLPNTGHPQRWLERVLRLAAIRKRITESERYRRYGEYLEVSRNRFPLQDWAALFVQTGWHIEAIEGKSRSALVMLVARAAVSKEAEGVAGNSRDSDQALQTQS